jgi:cell division protein FtsI (penicillin-binding protein 3)
VTIDPPKATLMQRAMIAARRLVLPARPDPAKSRRIAEARLVVSCGVAVVVFLTIGVRIVSLATATEVASVSPVPGNIIERGRILDRKGRLLATNLPMTVLHADPSEIMDVGEAARKLAPLIQRYDENDLIRLLSKKTRYVELDRKLTPMRHQAILQLGIPGVYFHDGMLRAYPRGNAAAHILGQVDPQNNGIAGIEKSMEARLTSGEDIQLSIDIGLQAIVAKEIHKQITEFEAIGGAGVLLDTRTGEVLAMVSLPDFNPNHLGNISADARFNRATKGLYEMGSTFKVLNTAIALEAGAVQLGQRYNVGQPLRVARFTINDYHTYHRPLNISEILVYSSNIGSAKMAEAIGPKTQRAFMDKLGLLDYLPLELPEVGRPLSPNRWKRIESMTVSYGHGISISPVHLASAVAAASGDGLWVAPTILRRNPTIAPVKTRVFSNETARSVRSMMRLVVSHPDGTGNFAEAPGYMVGGKTGTAEKILNGGYNKKANLATFVATFPVHDPRYVLTIMIDEPKGQKQSYGYATGGWVAAPAVRRIVEQAAPILGIHPVDENSPEIRQKLRFDLQIGEEKKTLATF